MNVADKVICLFFGHYYSRFERRNRSCVYCGTSQRHGSWKVRKYLDRRSAANEDIAQPNIAVVNDLLTCKADLNN
jgi:hypothetical protein